MVIIWKANIIMHSHSKFHNLCLEIICLAIYSISIVDILINKLCLSVCLSDYLSVCLCLSVCPVRQAVRWSGIQTVSLSGSMAVFLSDSKTFCLSCNKAVCLIVC